MIAILILLPPGPHTQDFRQLLDADREARNQTIAMAATPAEKVAFEAFAGEGYSGGARSAMAPHHKTDCAA